MTLDQLRDLGFTRRMVAGRVEKGRFAPVLRGVYAIGPRLSVRFREMAAVLQGGRSGVLSHRSAADLWGILSLPECSSGHGPGFCEISVVRSRRGSRAPGVHVHRLTALPEEDRTEHEGIPVTTPERTVLDLAQLASRVRTTSRAPAGSRAPSPSPLRLDSRATPAGGATEKGVAAPPPPFTPRDLERVVARPEREGLISVEGLRVRLGASPRRKGTCLLRRILAVEGGPAFTRSEAESRILARIRRARLPPPRVNVRVGRWELDLYWDEARLAVEVDGFAHHGSRNGFERDRAKDAELAARGILVIRVTWRQLQDAPEAVIGTIARALGQAEARAAIAAQASPR